MKKLTNLKGAKTLNRHQQKEIFGGTHFTTPPPEGGGGGGGSQRCDGNNPPCPAGEICCGPSGGAQYCQACSCEYNPC